MTPRLRSRLVGSAGLRVVVVAAALAGGACASAADRYDEGLALEAEGRWRDAALRYVDALDKDDTPAGTRERLALALDSAVFHGRRDAARWQRTGDAEAAAEIFLDLDDVYARAGAVGFVPAPPAGYAQDRRDALDSAVARVMDAGRDAEARGEWSRARGSYQRVRDRYLPTADQERAAWEAEARTLAAWGRAEVDAGRYRAGYERAGDALALEGPTPRGTLEEARRIQATARARGTRRVAVLPITARAVVGGMSAEATAAQLADVLELAYWREPPPLVAVADPVDVRQAVRRVQGGSPTLDTRDVARLLDALEADFGVLLEFTSLTLSERIDRTTSETARLRRGGSATYTVERGRTTFEGTVEVLIVDSRGLRVTGFTEEADGSGSFERGRYEGDPAELDLGRNEARRFEDALHRARQAEILEELVAELAEDLGRRIYEGVLARIP
ncbi:MAG: hypothetical protein RJQ04_07850 [Longimicrobiales bacterium]